MNNNPPFAPNQKVVALKTSYKRHGFQFIKGEIYTCAYCLKCTCGKWIVVIKEFIVDTKYSVLMCHVPVDDHYCGGQAKNFAPIETNYSDATAEILKEFPIEVGGVTDRIIVPVKEKV